MAYNFLGYRIPGQPYRKPYGPKQYLPARFGGNLAFVDSQRSSAPSGNPLTIFKTVPVLAWYRGDAVIQAANAVSQWTDKSGNGNHLLQGTPLNQPIYVPSNPSLNNTPVLQGDGVHSFLNIVAMVIAPQYYLWAVAKPLGWATGATIMGCPAAGGEATLLQSGAAPQTNLREAGSSTGQVNHPIGSWKRVACAENNTIADYLKVGALQSTGTALGRTAGSNNYTVFSAFGGGAPWNGDIAEIVITTGVPTLAEQSQMDAYGAARYLPSILT